MPENKKGECGFFGSFDISPIFQSLELANKDKCDFSDFLIMFLLYAHAKNVTAFPIIMMPVWHEFIFNFKTAYSGKFPELDCFGEFDWNEPYPKSRKLDELGNSLSNICFFNWRELTMFLFEDMRSFYEKSFRGKMSKHKKILKAMYAVAEKIPGFLKF